MQKKIFFYVIKQDVKLAMRRGRWFAHIIFLLMAATLFVFALGGNEELISKSAAAIIWICVLLATVMCSWDIFQSDYEDGSFLQLFLQQAENITIILAKVTANWLIFALPIIICLPVFAIITNFGYSEKLFNLFLSMLIATPLISCISVFSSLLLLGLKNNAFLSSLITLPLYIPILIFGILTTEGKNFYGIMAAIVFFMIPPLIWSSIKAAKIVLEH